MSGGHFNYAQNRISYEIACPLQQEILRNKIRPSWTREEDWDGQMWSDTTIDEFKMGLEALRVAYIYAQRIDWMLSGDDSEESFHKRLKHDLEHFQFDLPTQVDDED